MMTKQPTGAEWTICEKCGEGRWMPEQADDKVGSPEAGSHRREAGSRKMSQDETKAKLSEFDAQAEYDAATPVPISDERIEEIVKAVTASPSAYHRKLAEAILPELDEVALCDDPPDRHRNMIDRIAAALASEGVVDRQEWERMQRVVEQVANLREHVEAALADARAEIETLRAENERLQAKLVRATYELHEVACGCDNCVAIRAAKEQSDG